MILKNISKLITVFVCVFLINAAYLNTSFADDHTPKRNLINKLKEEITELGA